MSNVIKASFENVVPFAYQSAILKGQTLVNCLGTPKWGSSTESYTNGVLNFSDVWASQNYDFTPVVKPNTQYTAIFFLSTPIPTNRSLTIGYLSKGDWQGIKCYTAGDGVSNVVRANITSGDTSDCLRVRYDAVPSLTATNVAVSMKIVVLEGDWTNSELPVNNGFEGMVSCKMPVLMTTGKNLFDKTKTIFDKTINFNTGNITDATATNITDFIKVIPNTQYTMSFNFTTDVWTRCYGLTEPKHGKYITDANGASDKCYFDTDWNRMTFTTSPTTKYLLFSFGKGVEESFQLEQRSTATSYEPYKSNILTANEEVELHGIGDAHDTLDCLTGEVIKRIDEVVFDGSSDEDWQLAVEDGYTYKRFRTSCLHDKMLFIGGEVCSIICDKVPCYPNSTWRDDREGIDQDTFHITFRKNCETIEEFRQYLSKNPITIRYAIKTESIKTVDLKTLNESGETVHFMPLEGTMNVQSSGEIIHPTFDMSVPVEATTQNLASFIDLEMGNNNE